MCNRPQMISNKCEVTREYWHKCKWIKDHEGKHKCGCSTTW